MAGTVDGRRHVRLVFVSLLLDLVAFTVVLPLLPSILNHYERHDASGFYHTIANLVARFGRAVSAPSSMSGVLLGGALGSMFSLLQFVAAPITGRLSDAFGRRPLMLLCLVGIAVSNWLWYQSAINFAVFVLARVLCGLSKGNVNLSSAIVADVTDTEARGRGMAWIGVAFSLGFIIGPTLGGIITSRYANIGGSGLNLQVVQLPALISLSLSTINVLFVFFLLPESLGDNRHQLKRPSSKTVVLSTESVSNYISPVALLKFRAVDCEDTAQMWCLRRVGLVYFLYLLIFSGVEFTLTFHCHERFGFSAAQQGYMFLYMGSLMALMQGGLVRRLAEKRMEMCALFGICLLFPTFLLLASARSSTTLITALTLYAVSTAVCVPCLTTVATRYGGDQRRGIVTGVFRSLGALARAIGPLLSSTIFWLHGVGWCYLLAAVASLLPALLLAKFNCCKKQALIRPHDKSL